MNLKFDLSYLLLYTNDDTNLLNFNCILVINEINLFIRYSFMFFSCFVTVAQCVLAWILLL
jgi:hypothetical protein